VVLVLLQQPPPLPDAEEGKEDDAGRVLRPTRRMAAGHVWVQISYRKDKKGWPDLYSTVLPLTVYFIGILMYLLYLDFLQHYSTW
jgi:hypothetical protein